MTKTQFLVVKSDDDRVSIWPADRDIPWGWHEAGFSGTRAACLQHIEQTIDATVELGPS